MTVCYMGDYRGADCTALDHRPDVASLLIYVVHDVVEKWVMPKVDSNRFVLVAEANGRV